MGKNNIAKALPVTALHTRLSQNKISMAGAIFGLLLLALLRPWTAHAINASAEPVDLQQPDGTRITLRVQGDEFFHYYEDLNGFTVMRDRGNYVYANLDATGNFSPTPWAVGKADPAAQGLKKKILPPAQIRGKRRAEVFAAEAATTTGTAATSSSAPQKVLPTGTVKNLVILCKFSDHSLGTHTRAEADYSVVFNNVGTNATLAPSGSVRDFYLQNSYNTCTITSTIAAWVTLPQTEAYYGNGNDGLGSYPHNGQRMTEDALNAANSLVNFSQFDADNDGYVDAITIIHSGYGGETGGGGGDWMWSHRWSLPTPWSSGDLNGNNVSVKVRPYHTEPALWGTSGTAIVRIGVICHETGHFFGLPDFYDTDQSSEGIGSYCLMANSWGFDGTQLHPPHFSAYCKNFLGWLTPSTISPGAYSLPMVEASPTVYKITQGYPNGEYLLIENRQPYGFESDIPQGGLAIWHIDTLKTDNRSEGYPGQPGWPGNNSHYKIALLQADGQFDLEHNDNRGDSGDVFRGGGVSFIRPGPGNHPNTDAYQNGVVLQTANIITNISVSSSTMTFTYSAGSGAPSFTSQPTNRTVMTGNDVTLSCGAIGSSPMFYQWRFNSTNLVGQTNGNLILPSITTNEAGSYSVTVSNSFNTITSSNAVLTVTPLLTLAQAVDALALNWTTTSIGPWVPQTAVTHDGADAAQCGALEDLQTTSVQTTVNGPGTLTFWWKVSSEPGFDFLILYTNGVQVTAISGTNAGWTQVTRSIGAGTWNLLWTYAKDESLSIGADTAWLDQVTYTGPTAPVITTHPQDATVEVGDPAHLSVAASGTSLLYQWKKDGGILAGQTGSAFHLNSAQTNNSGVYSVIVSNSAGWVTSSNATLMVVEPCLFTLTPQSTNSDVAGFSGSVLITASDLSCAWSVIETNDWVTITSATSGTGSAVVTYTVAANSNAIPRTAILQIAGETFTLTQDGAPGSAALAGKTVSFAVTNGTGEFPTNGSFLAIISPITNTYRMVAVTGDTNISAGAYIYALGGLSNAVLVLESTNIQLTFNTPTTGSFLAANTNGDTQAGTFAILATAPDFNNDGRIDLVFQRSNRQQASWLLRGTTILSLARLSAGTSPGTAWNLGAEADLNADDQPDLVWQHTDGRVMTWLMSASNFNGSLPLKKARTGWKLVAAADFNEDTRCDLLFLHTTGKLAVWYMNGTTNTGGLTLNSGKSIGTGSIIAGVGDFDGNGSVDVLIQNSAGKLAAWYLQKGAFLRNGYLAAGKTAGSGWFARGVGDFDGDGKTDVVFQHSTGKIRMWFLNRSQFLRTTTLNGGVPIALQWQLIGPR
jgi:M6 family metalloprotease-like protein